MEHVDGQRVGEERKRRTLIMQPSSGALPKLRMTTHCTAIVLFGLF
jgi:hypothetical protein